MRDKLLSVIIPAYNTEKYIQQCVESIQGQTYQNVEVIIVDDGSTDKTGEVCKNLVLLDKRIKYIYQENAGVTAARTKGVEAATGEYITFVDSDDRVKEVLAEHMMKYATCFDLVACGFCQTMPRGEEKQLYNAFEGAYRTEEEMCTVWSSMLYDVERECFHSLLGSLCGKIFRKSMLLPILLELDKDIFFGEDEAIVLQYALKCNSAFFLKESLYFYEYRKNSTVNSVDHRILDNVHRIYTNLKSTFDKHILADTLNFQLEKWVIVLVSQAINKYLGFSWENRVPQFIVNLEEFVGKRIAIYGAGQLGRDIVWQYEKLGQKECLWVDKHYKYYQELGMDVYSVETLKNVQANLDAIIIAISDEKTVDYIKTDLSLQGVEEAKIIWKKPIRIY